MPEGPARFGEGISCSGDWREAADSSMGISGTEMANLLIADIVLPIDVGGVLSAASTDDEANIERREREDEVAVNMDESLSTEFVVLLFNDAESANPF